MVASTATCAPQWQPVNCDFESSCVRTSQTFQILSSHQDVRGDASVASRPLHVRELRGDGQRHQGSGHRQLRAVRGKRIWRRRVKSTSVMWTLPLLRQFLLGDAPEHGTPRSSWGTDPSRGKIGGLWTTPRVATLFADSRA